MGYLNLEDGLMACTCRGNSDKLDIRRKRYVVPVLEGITELDE